MTIRLRQCAVAVALMLSGAVYGQTATDATAVNNYKRYHGDGIDNVLSKDRDIVEEKTDGVGGIVCGKRRCYICSEA